MHDASKPSSLPSVFSALPRDLFSPPINPPQPTTPPPPPQAEERAEAPQEATQPPTPHPTQPQTLQAPKNAPSVAPAPAMPPTPPPLDEIVILRASCAKHRAQKTLFFQGDSAPRVTEYPKGAVWWKHETRPLTGFGDLVRLLVSLSEQEDAPFIVRGAVLPQRQNDPLIRRAMLDSKAGQAALYDTDRRWLCLDLDNAAATGDLSTPEGCRKAAWACVGFLPPALQGADIAVQFSSTANNAKAKAHIWLWLPRPVCNEALRAWARGYRLDAAPSSSFSLPSSPLSPSSIEDDHAAPIDESEAEEDEEQEDAPEEKRDPLRVFDPALFCAVQPHYLATPRIVGTPCEGWIVAKRWVFFKGKPLQNSDLPPSWVNSAGWQKKIKQEWADTLASRLAAFRPNLHHLKTHRAKESYRQAAVEGMIEEIEAVRGRQSERHETIRRVACRAMAKVRDGVIERSDLDLLCQAGKSILPKSRHRDVDRLFEEFDPARKTRLQDGQAPSSKPPSLTLRRAEVAVVSESTATAPTAPTPSASQNNAPQTPQGRPTMPPLPLKVKTTKVAIIAPQGDLFNPQAIEAQPPTPQPPPPQTQAQPQAPYPQAPAKNLSLELVAKARIFQALMPARPLGSFLCDLACEIAAMEAQASDDLKERYRAFIVRTLEDNTPFSAEDLDTLAVLAPHYQRGEFAE